MRDYYESKQWKGTVALAIVVLLGIFVAEIGLHVSAEDPNISIVELLSMGVLGANFAMGYAAAPYKSGFLKSHVLDLLAFVPLWAALRFAEMDYTVLRVLKIGSHVSDISGIEYILSSMKYRIG
jgi:hypothetical protein